MTTTPTMTEHARRRCAEMGITTKVAKRIVRNADICFPARPTSSGSTVLLGWSGDDRYRVVASEDRRVVLTVVFNDYQTYIRKGPTYIVIEETA